MTCARRAASSTSASEAEGRPAVDVAAVVDGNLAFSGRFAPMDRRDMQSQPTRPEQVRLEDWRRLKADIVVIGRIKPAGAGRYEIEFHVFDVFRGQALIEGADLPTLFLSAEGLTNHFYDFSASALASFRKHVSGSELVVFLITRDRTAWVKSYWKQCLIVPVIPEFDYGQPFTLSEFSDRPRVRRLADVQQLKLDLATGYGAHRIVDADFCEDWRTRLFQALEIDAADAFTQIGRTHGSISDAAAELVRQINGLGIPNSLRDTFLALLSEVEGDQNLTLLLVRRQYWAKLGQSAGDLEALLDRLEPCNSGEASLIEQLREELARQA